MTFEEVVAQIPQFSVEERKHLISIIVDSLTEGVRTRSLLEFEGVGEHLRDENMDAQEYINKLRDEWDNPT